MQIKFCSELLFLARPSPDQVHSLSWLIFVLDSSNQLINFELHFALITVNFDMFCIYL